MLTSIIAGAIIGMIAGALTSSDDRRGCLGNIRAPLKTSQKTYKMR